MTTERACRLCHIYGYEPTPFEEPYAHYECRGRFARDLITISDEWLALDATPGSGHTDRVSGTHETPLGVRAEVLDQMITPWNAEEPIRDNIPDQVGDTPASVVLDLIADEWREHRARDGHREHRPLPTVPVLCSWLRDRLDWACSRLPDSIDAHADEVRRLAGRLRALNGNTKAKTEPIPAEPCKHCGHIALVRVDGRVMCTNCSQYSGQWVDAIAGAVAKINDQEAA